MVVPSNTTTPVDVLIADGRPLFRASLARLLREQPLLRIAGEAGDADAVRMAVATAKPAVVVLDPFLPGDALALVSTLRVQHPRIEVLLYGVPADDTIIIRALQAGVKGFVDQDTDVGYLVAAICRVATGEVMVSPRLAHYIAASYAALVERDNASPRGASNELTVREFHVLQLIAAGYSNRAAAATLGISEHTVRAHLRSVSRKLGVQNRVQAVAEAVRQGLIQK